MSDIHSSRRHFLGAVAAAGAIAAISPKVRAETGHEHHAGKHTDLIHAAQHCVMEGEACVAHCYEQFESGNLELADCVSSVAQLVVSCRALASMASYDSEHLSDFAAVTAKVCKSCEKQCRKHEKTHEICRRCADACVDCIKASESYISA